MSTSLPLSEPNTSTSTLSRPLGTAWTAKALELLGLIEHLPASYESVVVVVTTSEGITR